MLSTAPLPWRRQLGIKLHPLGEQLPLLDTATGLPVPEELDKSVERWAGRQGSGEPPGDYPRAAG